MEANKSKQRYFNCKFILTIINGVRSTLRCCTSVRVVAGLCNVHESQRLHFALLFCVENVLFPSSKRSYFRVSRDDNPRWFSRKIFIRIHSSILCGKYDYLIYSGGFRQKKRISMNLCRSVKIARSLNLYLCAMAHRIACLCMCKNGQSTICYKYNKTKHKDGTSNSEQKDISKSLLA